MQFVFFLLNFLNRSSFFIKIEVVNKDGFLCRSNWHNRSVNFDEKSLLYSTKFNEKNQIASNFKKSRANWTWKKL